MISLRGRRPNPPHVWDNNSQLANNKPASSYVLATLWILTYALSFDVARMLVGSYAGAGKGWLCLVALGVAVELFPLFLVARYKWSVYRVKTLMMLLAATPIASAFDLVYICVSYSLRTSPSFVVTTLVLKLGMMLVANILTFNILRNCPHHAFHSYIACD